jgi:hypothetical protein
MLAKNVTPHVLRHTAAMRLLHAGVDTTVIALWLGHEGVKTTQIYLQADLTLKQQALDRTPPMASTPQPRRRDTAPAPTARPGSSQRRAGAVDSIPAGGGDSPGPPAARRTDARQARYAAGTREILERAGWTAPRSGANT